MREYMTANTRENINRRLREQIASCLDTLIPLVFSYVPGDSETVSENDVACIRRDVLRYRDVFSTDNDELPCDDCDVFDSSADGSRDSDVYYSLTSMYLDFRLCIERIMFRSIKEWAGDGFRTIRSDEGNKPVGFLVVIDRYVHAIYVCPEYRRKGLARKAVMEYLSDGNAIDTLHIVNDNDAAKAFWNSIFVLEEIDFCPVDTLYKTVRLRGNRERFRHDQDTSVCTAGKT